MRHRFGTILAVSVCAVLAGARSYVAIAEWARDLGPGVRIRLGLALRRPPSESTIRRGLQAVDAEESGRVVSAWLAERVRGATVPGEPLVIAVDGKSVRGARTDDDRRVHLLGALHAGTGVVLGQVVVDGKTNEINAFAPLLERVEITGAIVTADALHTQTKHVEYLHGRGAHWILTVKANQPTLLNRLRALPWTDVPVADRSHGKGHGRVESRTVKVTAVAAGIGFPHAHQAIHVTRRTRRAKAATWHTETVYAVTDLDFDDITPARLADAIRAHWGIENRLHWVRDVTLAEDLSPDPHRQRPRRDRDAAKPRHQPPPPVRRGQHRRRLQARQPPPGPSPPPGRITTRSTLPRPWSSTARWCAELGEIVEFLFADSDGTCRYRRVHAALARAGRHGDPQTVRSIMAERGLVACQPRPKGPRTTIGSGAGATPDLIGRDFTATQPGHRLVGDI